MLRGALLQLGFGLAIALPASLGAGRVLESQLYGVSGHDPATLAIAALSLSVCAFLAALVPARRAATIDPMRALRTE